MAGFKFTPRWQDMAELLRDDPDRYYAMMEDRERGLEAYLNYGEATYTPEITATTTAPSVGDDGYEFGVFALQGRMCDWSLEIAFQGAGVGAGSGNYLIPLPVPPLLYTVNGVAIVRYVGDGQLVDSGTGTYGCSCVCVSTTSATHFLVQANRTGAVTWTNSNPITVVSGDRFWGRYMIDEQ